MTTVFISYSGEDRTQAARLAGALEALGWSVWWDRKIIPGRHFDLVIERELDNAKAVVVLWSKSSVKSEWVKNEAASAADRGVLIPALIEDCRLPLEFRRRQAADLIGWNGDTEDAGFKALSDGVAELSGTPVSLARANPSHSQRAAPPKKRGWIVGGIAAVAVVLGVGGYAGLRLLAPGQGKLSPDDSASVTVNPRSTAGESTPNPQKSSPGTPVESSAGVGWLEFKWPGNDCWAIYRGEQKAASTCGGHKQALQVGTYVVKPSSSAVFEPFSVDVKPGLVTSTDAMAGWLDFKWPGNDCWSIYRGDQKAASACGGHKQALQAGTYVVKPSSSAAFEPFKIQVTRGHTLSAP